MLLFDQLNYRDYLKAYIAGRPNEGRGEVSRIARELAVHPTLISLILSGERELTLDQAFALSRYLQFTPEETDYFSLLVQWARASTVEHRNYLKTKIDLLRLDASKIANQFAHELSLDDQQRAVFYSSWLYSAIRLYADTDSKGRTLEQICQKFQIDRQRALPMIKFLLQTGLLQETGEFYKLGAKRTFLEHGSPYLVRHHTNWRLKSLQEADRIDETELMFTSPMSISRKDFATIRQALATELKKISEIIKDSPSEDVACLNIDFFWIKK